MGHTRDEYSLFNTRCGSEVTEDDVTATLGRLAPDLDSGCYSAAFPEVTPGLRYKTVHSDWLFRMPSLHLANAQHAGGGRAWTYELCRCFNRDEGASHSLDFLLVFGTLSIDDVRSHPTALPSAAGELGRVLGPNA